MNHSRTFRAATLMVLFVVAIWIINSSNNAFGVPAESVEKLMRPIDYSLNEQPKDPTLRESLRLWVERYNTFRAEIIVIVNKNNIPTTHEPLKTIKCESGRTVYYFNYDYRGRLSTIRLMTFSDADTSKSQRIKAESFLCDFEPHGLGFDREDGRDVLSMQEPPSRAISFYHAGEDNQAHSILWRDDGTISEERQRAIGTTNTQVANIYKIPGAVISESSRSGLVAAHQAPKDEKESGRCKELIATFDAARKEIVRDLENESYENSMAGTAHTSRYISEERKERINIEFQPASATIKSIIKHKFKDRIDGLEDRDKGFVMYFDKLGNVDSFELMNNRDMLYFYPDLKIKMCVRQLEKGVNYEVRWNTEGVVIQEGIRNYHSVQH